MQPETALNLAPFLRWALRATASQRRLTKRSMHVIILVLLAASSAFAGEFTVDGVDVERPAEAKQYGICKHFTVTPKDAALFFSIARPTTYQDEDLMIGPCKAFGSTGDGENSSWEIYIGGAGVIYRNGADPQWFYCGKKCCAMVGQEICG